jgi:hypothetical protein
LPIDVDRLQLSSGSASVAVGASDFAVGGRASSDGASGLAADVGATATLRLGSGITFDD